ncbi:LacI family transcriptional regulator, partial [Cellulomonas bogoriensis 69B4 = DSM 16987]
MASGAIGLVLARPTRLLGVEPFFMELIGGMEERFVERGLSVLLHVVPGLDAEMEAYRRWAASGLTDAVVVVNLVDDDPRPALLRELGLTAVLVGDMDDQDHAVVRTDDEGPMRDVAMRLVARGHRRLARVTGPAGLTHTRGRTRALLAVAAEAG